MAVDGYLLHSQKSDLSSSLLSTNKQLTAHCASHIHPLQTFPPVLAGDPRQGLSLFLFLLFNFWRPQRKTNLPGGSSLDGRTDVKWALLYLPAVGHGLNLKDNIAEVHGRHKSGRSRKVENQVLVTTRQVSPSCRTLSMSDLSELRLMMRRSIVRRPLLGWTCISDDSLKGCTGCRCTRHPPTFNQRKELHQLFFQ